jgi:putative membrane protein
MYDYGYRYSWLWMLGMNLLWIIGIIAAVVLIVKLVNRDRVAGGRNLNRALEILQERYAKGEISEEEYLKRKRMLNSK